MLALLVVALLVCTLPLRWYTVISPLPSTMADRRESPIEKSETTSNVLPTKTDPTSARFEANMRFLADLMSQVRNEGEKICEGGGAKAIESQHNKGRKTGRERIDLLVDAGSFFELGLFAAHGMYEEWGGAPAAGVITGLARIETRLVMIIANDATVKAGAFFPMTSKKVIRAQNIAVENRIPTIYLVNAVMSAMGIPQIAAIMGMCVAGGGYLPVMCDHVLMTDGSGLFLAGPALVQAAIGQKVSAEELGGAAMHSAISGTVDFREPNEEACLTRIRSIIGKWGYRRQSPWDRRKPVDPLLPAEEMYGIYDSSPARPYDMKEILARLLDGSRFDEYKAEYGKTLVCGYGRIGGFAVGIVANQKLHAQATDHEGHKRVEFGGVIYTESAEKAARFIMDCNQNLIPLIFFHDVNGFMVGRDAEWSGIIKAGAKMVNAVSNSVVPKITVIVGGSFGAGHYAMCGKAYDPRFIFAWPTARYAVMSGDAAAGTLVEIKIKQLERSGKTLSDEEGKQLLESTKRAYDEQTDPRYGAARLWIDKIIDPVETREAITQALEAAALNPDVAEFKVGVLQT